MAPHFAGSTKVIVSILCRTRYQGLRRYFVSRVQLVSIFPVALAARLFYREALLQPTRPRLVRFLDGGTCVDARDRCAEYALAVGRAGWSAVFRAQYTSV